MNIEHIAIWVNDLEVMRNFYETYFQAACGPKYHNPEKQFTSYFLSFPDGARLELMQKPGVHAIENNQEFIGYAHIAISLGSKNLVDKLTLQLLNDGYTAAGKPRTTGDGYYESVICDPEGNRIELTI